MTKSEGPIAERRSRERRGKDRRGKDRRAGKSGLPVPVGEARPADGPAPSVAEVAFAAQVLGQSGQKRGLKGGPPVLEAARAAYLEAEWSGRQDRRRKTGKVAKTEI